ncbi:MAG: helicase, partial [Haloarculaceae archaeon]
AVQKRRGTWQYFYQNLSMIPDESTYRVEDVASGRQVGTLDERFVVNFASPGEIFIQGGEMWRISEVDQEEETVTVSPVADPAGEVPSWTGQEIPVPGAVAREVAEVRRVVAQQLGGGLPPSERESGTTGPDAIDSVAADVGRRYDVGAETVATGLEAVADQMDADLPVPGPADVLVEFERGSIVVHAPVGHQTNETLGRLLSSLLGQQAGSTVGMDVDPYRIELDVPRGVTAEAVVDVLEDTDPDHVEAIIELSLKNADALTFKLAQVAAKFGALKRWKSTGGTPFGRDRLVDALAETPVYEEAVRELLHEELDVDAARDVLRDVQDGDLAVATVDELTPIGLGGRSSGQELLTPENADASVIQTVKERIQHDRVILACLHCQDWETKRQVKRVSDQPECPTCGSTQITALNPWDDEVVAAVRADEKDDEEENQTKRAYHAASLVQSHGKQAVVAMAARGVGPHNAARIINKLREDEEDFYRDILSREREYARTRSFWD